MVQLDPDTGEILPDSPPTSSFALSNWGEEAIAMLHAVDTGRHYRKKRTTLLRLAEATYLNRSQASVFRDSHTTGVASRVAHYKWRNTDQQYEACYQYLVGDPSTPGVAKLAREQELDEDEGLAISALVEARTRLQLATAEAVKTLVAALSAKDRYGPLWRERIVAANSILERSDDTAGRSGVGRQVTLVDKAILTVYNMTQNTGPDSIMPALPSGNLANDANQGTTLDPESQGITHDSTKYDVHGIPLPAEPADEVPGPPPTIIDGRVV